MRSSLSPAAPASAATAAAATLPAHTASSSPRAAQESRRPASMSIARHLLLASTLGLACVAHAAVRDHAAAPLNVASQALMQGRIDEAIASLQHIVSSHPDDGPAYLLLCRSFYAEEHQDEAISTCENAVRTLPRSSDAFDWMGRAYGMKASHAGPLAGFGLARKVRSAFETAVQLDPNNAPAVNDLSEFYINAPGIVGGGQDKAVDLANRTQATLPQVAHRIRALLADKHKDYDEAERQFKAAVDDAHHPDAWVDLGAFYMRRNQPDQSVAALRQCIAADHAKDASLVDVASILNSRHLEPQLAQRCLEDYLRGPSRSDAAPVIKVHVMLAKLLAAAGDKPAAKIEVDKALALASGYAPARQALREL